MKKLLLFILCISCWTQSFSQSDINLTPEEEEEAWEFITKTFFNQGFTGNSDVNYPEKYYFGVNYYLKNSIAGDSIALQSIILVLDSILPQKVKYVTNEKEANFIIEVNYPTDSIFFKYSHSPLVSDKTEDPATGNILHRDRIVQQNFKLSVRKEYRAKAIRNTAAIGLLAGFKYQRYMDGFSYEYKRDNPDFESILKNFFLHRRFSETQFHEIPAFDKFILQKMYTTDLTKQVGEYVKQKYGYWLWFNFTYPTHYLKIIKIFILLFLGFLSLWLGYLTVFRKHYKFLAVNYMLQGIYIGTITLLLFLISIVLKIYEEGEYFTTKPNIPTIHAFIKVLLWVVLLSSIFSIILYAMDSFARRRKDLLSRAIIRIFNFTMTILLFSFILQLTGQIKLRETILLLIIFSTFGICRSIFLYFKERNENLIREKDLQLSQLTASKAEAEVASLHARINPHFLYNSLNSIAGLAHIDADKTERMAISLSDLFRHNLNRKNEPFCTIKEEVEATVAYMEIEQIRFGEQLQFHKDIDEAVCDHLIPRNIIQPLLENAIKHGVSKIQTPGKIKLQIMANGEHIEISVYDNGTDFQEGSISGYGLQSISDILNLTYKDDAELGWEKIPQKRI